MSRQRCAVSFCRHAPNAHADGGSCRLCACGGWLTKKRHTWRAQVTDAWLLATETWLRHREAVAIGYDTEEREFEEHHPRPRLADFMDAMRPGVPPEVVEELSAPCRCCVAASRERIA